MKGILILSLFALSSMAAHAEYEQVNMTVFGMDCAPCAHAIHVSMKGIKGVDTVNVDLNTGMVNISLSPGNTAGMHQFEEAVEKNGFTLGKVQHVAAVEGNNSAPAGTVLRQSPPAGQKITAGATISFDVK